MSTYLTEQPEPLPLPYPFSMHNKALDWVDYLDDKTLADRNAGRM